MNTKYLPMNNFLIFSPRLTNFCAKPHRATFDFTNAVLKFHCAVFDSRDKAQSFTLKSEDIKKVFRLIQML